MTTIKPYQQENRKWTGWQNQIKVKVVVMSEKLKHRLLKINYTNGVWI